MGKADGSQKHSYRIQWKFWLDAEKPEELSLSDYCAELKNQRTFTATIRDGLRLMRDLKNQQLGVLFELFPWVNAWLEERAQAIARSGGGNSGGGEGSDLKALQSQIDRLEQALLSQTIGNAIHAARLGTDRIPKFLPPPQADNLDIEMVRQEIKAGQIFSNFKKSLQGVSAAPVAEKTVKPKKIKKEKPKELPASDGKIKQLAGASLNFAAPDFDDLGDL